jgi:RNA polymerase primary sigma factor
MQLGLERVSVTLPEDPRWTPDDLVAMLDRLELSNPEFARIALNREVEDLLGRRPAVVSPLSRPAVRRMKAKKKKRAFAWYQPLESRAPAPDRDLAMKAAQVVEAGLFAEEQLRCMDLDVATRRQVSELEILRFEGQEAYSYLVLSNVRLVFFWCKGLARSLGPDAVQDAFQAGCLGLMRGIQGWDHRMGFTLATYVSWHIRQAITRWRYNETSLIRLPVHIGEQMDSETPVMTPETRTVVDRTRNVVSLSWGDVDDLIGAWDGGMDEVVESAARTRSIEVLFQVLTEREAMVLRMRNGAAGGSGEPMTLDEIGLVCGVTRERIRQIEMKALGKLREFAQTLAGP